MSVSLIFKALCWTFIVQKGDTTGKSQLLYLQLKIMKHIMLYLLYYAMISFEHTMLQYLRNYEEV